MKTITEFVGFQLTQAAALKREIFGAPEGDKTGGRRGGKNRAERGHPHTQKRTEPLKFIKAGEVQAAAQTEAEAASAPATEPAAAPSETTEPAPVAETPAAAPEAAEDLGAKLKTAIAEKFKLEGDRLDLFVAALESVGRKTDHLKRVVALSLSEGEKAPSGSVTVGDKVFIAEYFAVANPVGRDSRRPARGGKRGERNGKGRSERNDRGRRSPRDEQRGLSGGARAPRPEGTSRPEGAPTQPRNRRPPRPRRGPPGVGGVAKIIPVDQTTGAPAPASDAPASAPTPSES